MYLLDARAREAHQVWDELWPEARSVAPRVIADRLARHIGLRQYPLRDGAVERSWGETWARTFAASVDALDHIESNHPWVLQSSYRDGAGYYIHFDPCGCPFQGFYLNEAGYISCNRLDHELITSDETSREFDIVRLIERGASRKATRDELLSVIKPMIKGVEAAGVG